MSGLFGMGAGMGIVIMLLLIVMYFLPWIIAANRNHHQTGAIAVLNIFLGWSFLGWVIALIWSLTAVLPTEGKRRESYVEAASSSGEYGQRQSRHGFANAAGQMSDAETKRCPECGEAVLAIAKKCKHCQATLPEPTPIVAKNAATKQCPECGETILATAKKCKHCQADLFKPLPMSAIRFTSSRRAASRLEGETNYLWIAMLILAVFAVGAVAIWWARAPDNSETFAQHRGAAQSNGETLISKFNGLFGGSSDQKTEDEDFSEVRTKVQKLMGKVDIAEKGITKYFFAKGTMPSSCVYVSVCAKGVSIGEDGRIVLDLSAAGDRKVDGKSIVAFPSLIAQREVKWRCTTDADFRFVPLKCQNSLPKMPSDGVESSGAEAQPRSPYIKTSTVVVDDHVAYATE